MLESGGIVATNCQSCGILWMQKVEQGYKITDDWSPEENSYRQHAMFSFRM